MLFDQREKSYLFFSLFSLISSLEKSRGRFREKWRVKREEWRVQKEKAACATFLFVLYRQFRCHHGKVKKIKVFWTFRGFWSVDKIDANHFKTLLRKRITQKNNRSDSKNDTYPLLCWKLFLEQQHCRKRCKHKTAAVYDGEKHRAVHYSREIEIEFVIDSYASSACNHDSEQKPNLPFAIFFFYFSSAKSTFAPFHQCGEERTKDCRREPRQEIR